MASSIRGLSMSPDAWKKLANDPLFITGTVLAVIVSILLIAAPWLTAHDPHDIQFQPFSPPSSAHWLGVNDGGMDIFAELLAGLGNTLNFGFVTGLTTLLIGVVVGLTCAWAGGRVDQLLMRCSDILLAVPPHHDSDPGGNFFSVRPRRHWDCFWAAMAWPTTAKGIRAQALVIRQGLHIQAARQMGASGFYIIGRHMLPELFPLYLIGFASKARMAMFMEASLSFLGLFDPSRKSLGMMINYALKYYYLDIWWNWLLPPIFCLTLSIMAVTFLAVSLERVFDPRLGEVWQN